MTNAGDKGRRSRRTVVLITVIMVVLLAEGALVAAVFISPKTGERLQGVVAAADRAWSGTKNSPGIRTRVARAFHGGYENWIAPLYSSPATPKGDTEFATCVNCHADYGSKRRFMAVFMNHPLHAQLGVACGTCHTANDHPDPVHPQEKVCATCHAEVQTQGKCGFCHPPASLPHFYLLGAPRQGVVECDVCHPKQSFQETTPTPKVHITDLTGTNRQICLSCHTTSTCNQCHGTPHPSNWVQDHGPIVGEGTGVDCYTCHVSTWCADRCHSVTPTNPLVPRPIPTVGVRP